MNPCATIPAMTPAERARNTRYKKGGRFPQANPNPVGQPTKFFEWMSDDILPIGWSNEVTVSIFVALAAGQVDGVHVDFSDASMIVEYGTGDEADECIVEVDLVNGTRFSIPAKSAIFRLNYPVNPNANLVTQPTLDISVSVAFGECASGRAPQKTVKVGALAMATESNIFPIPRYARDAVLQTNDALTTAVLKEYCAPVAGANLLSEAAIIKTDPSVPIVNGARGFSLTAAAAATGAAVIFYLTPG